MNDKLIITPKTKVLQLIEAYPQCETLLIEYIPAFDKLKNPILRRTVAGITTLQQAAQIGDVRVEDLINKLRKAVGQDLFTESASTSYTTEKPGWFDEQRIVKELDASLMLAEGEQPVALVMADLQHMAIGSIYKLKVPFLPAPLIDKATSLAMQHWVIKLDEAVYVVYFYKPQGNPILSPTSCKKEQ